MTRPAGEASLAFLALLGLSRNVPVFPSSLLIAPALRCFPCVFSHCPAFSFVSSALSFRFSRKRGGPGAKVVPLSQNGRQRSGLSAGTVFGFMPLFVSPAKAGA